MRVLGIETSCDENSAAVVEDGRRLLSNVVFSQVDLHKTYGGVVPEVAARSHIEVMTPTIDAALEQAAVTWNEIDCISVAHGPGLGGSLLIGTLAARTLALVKNKPLYGVHHALGHIYANFIDWSQGPLAVSSSAGNGSRPSGDTRGASRRQQLPGSLNAPAKHTSLHASPLHASPLPSAASAPTTPDNQSSVMVDENRKMKIEKWQEPVFPVLALVVSGGHSHLVLMKSHAEYELLSQTQDDAAGEAFDKVAKILGLAYPGGPSIEKAAQRGDPQAFSLPKARMDGFNYSFSGLKTAVLRTVQDLVGVGYDFPSSELKDKLSASQVKDLAASFQSTVAATLVDTLIQAYQQFKPQSVVIAGGVAANQELRRQLKRRLPIEINYAPIWLCTDNGAMIASLGYYAAQHRPPDDPLKLDIRPSLALGSK